MAYRLQAWTGHNAHNNDIAPILTSDSDLSDGATEQCGPESDTSRPPAVQEVWSPSHNSSQNHNQSIPQPSPQVVIQQPTPSSGPGFRDVPIVLTDRSGNPYTTELRYVNGLLTWVAVGVTCLVAGAFCCPLIGLLPLCIRELKDIEHINPDTGQVVGKFDRGASLGL